MENGADLFLPGKRFEFALEIVVGGEFDFRTDEAGSRKVAPTPLRQITLMSGGGGSAGEEDAEFTGGEITAGAPALIDGLKTGSAGDEDAHGKKAVSVQLWAFSEQDAESSN